MLWQKIIIEVSEDGYYMMIQMEFEPIREHSFAKKILGSINKNWLLLDTQITCNMLCSLAYATNIHKANPPIYIHCIAGTTSIIRLQI